MAKSADILTLAADPVAFRRALRIDVDGSSRSLADCLDPWQAADFEAMDPAWRRLVGQAVDVEYSRAWLERPRGHSKTTDFAVSSVWVLLISRRRLSGLAAAGDRDQARLLRDAIDKLVQLNPWLTPFIEVQALRVANPSTGSELKIMASDAPSSYGETPDFVIMDEVTHWPRRDMFTSLMSSAAKRENCVVISICNAGFAESWQHEMRESVQADPMWHFHSLDGPQASWITADRLAEQERLLPTIAFERLWLNRWSSGAGDAITPADIVSAIDAGLKQLPVPCETYVAGLDLGISHDNSALVIVGKNRDGKLALRRLHIWRPPGPKLKMDLQAIEDCILKDCREFNVREVRADPHQAEQMVQRLQQRGVPIATRQQTGGTLIEQAASLISAFRDGVISIPDHDALVRELNRVMVQERSYGYRLVSRRDKDGHGDAVTSLSIALAVANHVTTTVHHLEGWDPPADALASLRGEPSTRSTPASRMSFGRGRFGIKI